MEYFFEQQPPVQFQQLAATSHQSMSKLPDYYPATAEMYLPGVPRTRSLFGAADDELTCLVESSRKPRARKRSLCGIIGDGSGEKKEKQRRMRLSDKFTALMILIPNRTKEDRATIVGDAIEYIQELGRTVEELSLLMEKKREHQGDVVDASAGDSESSVGESAVVPIQSTFIQRKSMETSVDVRIVEDEVNIRLTNSRSDGCLAAASLALDHLGLDLVHLSGGKIDDCHVYMFNTKIHQGSPVFASAVASKLIELVDGYYLSS
ncbi:transcription factor TIP2-like [Lolium rigidum]|uniref:transcription factor TIP2-like n=1 Tax=Lolium rigidum TaxID=89674 RepID=UPI001F5C9FAE|nr:transcription factor TIP2-like [Lolium rigidum]